MRSFSGVVFFSEVGDSQGSRVQGLGLGLRV